MNVADLLKQEDKKLFESQANFRNLANARFTMVDMTDYDYNYSGPDEVGGSLGISNWGLLGPRMKEAWP